jgi:hypothetical protein
MPDIHLPRLDDHDDSHAMPARAGTSRTKSFGKLALEVVLISTGVFLGLAGEQWRESRREHEQARTTIENFHHEVETNRKQLASVAEYHLKLRGILRTYLLEPGPKTFVTFAGRGVEGFQTVSFRHGAWDLAVATGALSHVDPRLAFTLSDVYTDQQRYETIGNQITTAVYAPTALTSEFRGLLIATNVALSDLIAMEPRLLKGYDDLLPRLAEAAAK